MNEEDVKDELGLHLAKTILVESVKAKELVSRTVTGICTISIPCYIALLKLLSADINSIPLWSKLMPLIMWITALITASAILFPKITPVDFKNPQQLIASHSTTIKRIRVIGIILFIVAVAGVVWMSAILVPR